MAYQVKLHLDQFLLNELCLLFREIGLDVDPQSICLTRKGSGFNRINRVGTPKTNKDGSYFIDAQNPVIGFFAENKSSGEIIKGNCWKDIIKPKKIILSNNNGILTNDTYQATETLKKFHSQEIHTTQIGNYHLKNNDDRAEETRNKYLKIPPIKLIKDHSYIIRKGFQSILGHGIKFITYTGAIVIPLYDTEGQINAVQHIYPDEATHSQNGYQKKCFGPYANCFYVVCGDTYGCTALAEINHNNGLLFICEGFATALSIYTATGNPTIMAISAGNIPSVVKSIRDKYKDITIVVCADRDKKTPRTIEGTITIRQAGHESVKKAYEAITKESEWSFLWLEYILPDFKVGDSAADGGKLSDFNDIHTQYGFNYLLEHLATKLAIMQFNNSIKTFKQNESNIEYNRQNHQSKKLILETKHIFDIKKRFVVANLNLQEKIVIKYKQLINKHLRR